MRIALFSDVHADLHALHDALSRIDALRCDLIVCAGDLVDYGLFPEETLELLAAMTHAIKAEFRYQARYEEGTRTPAETLRCGYGTCRDFAVLMMEAVRSLGLAAKFVTGYLYDHNFGEARGGGATHAWCSVYLPGAGWVEYDPTNGLIAGANLVRIGMTRASEQAIPIAGGYLGGADDTLGLHVDVTVSAVPIEANARPFVA